MFFEIVYPMKQIDNFLNVASSVHLLETDAVRLCIKFEPLATGWFDIN